MQGNPFSIKTTNRGSENERKRERERERERDRERERERVTFMLQSVHTMGQRYVN